MVEDLEDGLLGSPKLSMGEKRETVAVVADKQMILEAAIEIPPGVDESLFYLFSLHFLFLSRNPSFMVSRYCVT